MHEDDPAVGVDRLDRVQCVNVVGALEDPATARFLMLQVLKEPLVEAIGRKMANEIEPVLIGRYPMRRLVAQALEDLRRDFRAFLRAVRRQRMQRLYLRGQDLKQAQLALHLSEAFVAPFYTKGIGKYHILGTGHAHCGVLRQQRVEQRRTAPGKAGDEDGAFDPLRQDAAIFFPPRPRIAKDS